MTTLVNLRHGVTHDVPACRFGGDRSTVTRAIGEVRSLLADRGCAISPGMRPRTLAGGPTVEILADAGHQGLRTAHAGKLEVTKHKG
ncbi:transposase family protein [Streptomyces sp. NPDC088116]|uniref:helix-turn-helix domain-containing protein n=1 Tax=Streptomyces sp. NPDC088116 TaxID=3365825 RepID=UPI003808B711